MKYSLLISLITAAALSTGVWANDTSSSDKPDQGTSGSSIQDQSPKGTAQDKMQPDAQQAGATIQNPDQRFLHNAYNGVQQEIQLGQWVQDKVQDSQIKDLAKKIVQDHQQFSQKIQQTAQQIGLDLTKEQPADSQMHKGMLEYFQNLPTDQLGRSYVFHEAGTHQMALLWCQYEANNAQDANVKQLAQQLATSLQKHQAEVQQVAQAQIGGTGGAQPAGGRITPDSGQQGGSNTGSDTDTNTGGSSGSGSDTDRKYGQ